jgi:hypothetical protein
LAKRFGIITGGTMPKGFLTLFGPRPEWAKKYNLIEHASSSYAPRTYQNVRDSDGTIRFAGNFSSAGEICTLKAINQYKKPYIDVDLNNPRPVLEVVEWINKNNISVLNVAGNSEKTWTGTSIGTMEYLTEVFRQLGFKEES